MSGGGCAGRKKGRERKALTCGPGSPEREGRLARGAALSEGERGRARLAGPASCAARAWAGWATLARWAAGKKKERGGRNGPAGKKRKRPGGLGWAGAGVKGRSRAGPPEDKKLGWPGLGFGLGFFSFLFLNQSKLNLFEFKFEFEFKPHSTKNKLCTSMNSQTSSTQNKF